MPETLEKKISFRMSKREARLLQNYCKKYKIKPSALIRVVIMERIQNEKIIFQPQS
jgi:hypothetical protein